MVIVMSNVIKNYNYSKHLVDYDNYLYNVTANQYVHVCAVMSKAIQVVCNNVNAFLISPHILKKR